MSAMITYGLTWKVNSCNFHYLLFSVLAISNTCYFHHIQLPLPNNSLPAISSTCNFLYLLISSTRNFHYLQFTYLQILYLQFILPAISFTWTFLTCYFRYMHILSLAFSASPKYRAVLPLYRQLRQTVNTPPPARI